MIVWLLTISIVLKLKPWAWQMYDHDYPWENGNNDNNKNEHETVHKVANLNCEEESTTLVTRWPHLAATHKLMTSTSPI